MQSIQLMIDGQKAGTLWNDRPCTITLTQGTHTILPKKIGIGGQAFDVTVGEGETRHLTLHDVSISRDFFGLLFVGMLINAIPNDVLGGQLMLWIKIAFFTVEFVALFFILRWHPQKKITISESPSEQAASFGNLAKSAQ